jgi:nitrogen fixation/metabolism regulation signal transduction histidine kinase
MNEQNMIALFGLIGALLYFVVGRAIINILEEKRSEVDGWRVVEGHWRFFKILFFPLIIVWEVVVMMSDYLTGAVIGFFDNNNRMRARKGRKLED